MQGIILENISNLYKISKENNKNDEEIYEATARGRLKKEDIFPVVGDLVEFEITNEDTKKAVIDKILDRKVYVKRPKLANITKLVFVISSQDPSPDLLMLDKQLAFAEFLGVEVLIVLNKMDLDKQKEFIKIKNTYERIGYKVIETEAKAKKGIEKLKKELEKNINAFSGNSGVGKSTLINGIFEEYITQEGEISKRNKRGKNTTTIVKLYKIGIGTYIADTPGFSSFSIEEIKSKNLANYFKEFKGKIQDCEFVGCTHIKEENCGIKRAVERGEISKNRYERFCKIFQQLKQGEEKRKW